MASENEKYETLADIVAEIRRAVESMSDELPYAVSAVTVRKVADRIEAAAKRDAAIHAMTCEANERLREHLEIALEDNKRPVGNAAAMREALDAALSFIGNLEIEPYSPLDEAASELRQRIMDALSTPARQCDVGTAEEQVVRFSDAMIHECFADEYCRCKDAAQCFARWAQTPYEAEEGGAE